MKVFFPEGIRPQEIEHDVWYAVGESQARHDEEYERVEGCLQQTQEGLHHTLVASIPYPVLGLTYVIKWTLPGSTPSEAEGSSPTDES